MSSPSLLRPPSDPTGPWAVAAPPSLYLPPSILAAKGAHGFASRTAPAFDQPGPARGEKVMKLRNKRAGEGNGEAGADREGKGSRSGCALRSAPRVTFRGALVEVAAVERRAWPEVLQVLGRRFGWLWEVGLQGPAGRKAGQPRAAGWCGVQVRRGDGGPLGTRRLIPRGRIGAGPGPHAERRAALGVHAGSGRTGRRGSGARAARAACKRPPRGRDLGAGAQSPRERRAPRGAGDRRGASASDLMLEPSTSRAAPRGLTPRSPGAP